MARLVRKYVSTNYWLSVLQRVVIVTVPASVGEDMAALLGGIAQLARGQAIVLERLSFLEKIVGTVQFDMTWVRDDVKSVHEAMDRFADFACDF